MSRPSETQAFGRQERRLKYLRAIVSKHVAERRRVKDVESAAHAPNAQKTFVSTHIPYLKTPETYFNTPQNVQDVSKKRKRALEVCDFKLRYDPTTPASPRKKIKRCLADYGLSQRYDPHSPVCGGGVSRKRPKSSVQGPSRKSPRLNNVNIDADASTASTSNSEAPVDLTKKPKPVSSGETSKPLDEKELDFFRVTEHENEKFFQDQMIVHTASIMKITGPSGVAMAEHLPEFRRIVDKIVTDFIAENCQPHEHLQIVARCKHGEEGRGVTTEFFKAGLPEPQSRIFGLIARSLNSGAKWMLDNEIEIVIKHVKNPPNIALGARCHSRNFPPTNLEETARRKKSMVLIVNQADKMCVARALAVTRAKKRWNASKRDKPHLSGLLQKEFKAIARQGSSKQAQEAASLYRRIDHDPSKTCGPVELRNLENLLNIYIKVLAGHQFNELSYNGVKSNFREDLPVNDETVYFIRQSADPSNPQELHADAIVSRSGFFGTPCYCFFCDKAFKELRMHKCGDVLDWCFSCSDRDCRKQDKTFPKECCTICQINFRSAKCRSTHLKEADCKKDYFCPKCRKIEKRNTVRVSRFGNSERLETNFDIKKRHKCKNVCRLCKEDVDGFFHKCYIQPTPFTKTNEKILFYDFETDQSSKTHEPILCHAVWYNPGQDIWHEKCFWVKDIDENNPDKPLPSVKQRVGKFLCSTRFKGYTMIAHNMKSFDGCFILQYMAENGIKPVPILSGLKIMALEVKGLNIRFIDSLNFLPMPLASFEKAFGLQSCEKGHFPHFFAEPKHYNYRGPLPPVNFYGSETMREDFRLDFLRWYVETTSNPQSNVFDFENDIKKYCKQDVHVLKEGCLAFKNLLMDLTDKKCDAFTYTTLASVASAIFKATYLKPEQIAAVPPNGYASIQNFSSVSLEWLEWVRQKTDLAPNLKHVGNSPVGEGKVGPHRTDGYDETTKEGFEFHGCYYHGCPKCFPDRNALNKTMGKTFEALYKQTQDREFVLLLQPELSNLHIMWECEWTKKKLETPEILAFVEANQENLKPMDPFLSFFGGRVEPLKLQVSDGRKMHYFDVTSLYPFINATKRYPIGHPTILLNDFGDLDTVCDRFFGFIKCRILPPEKLYIPVLPGKFGEDKKLLFALCRTCAEERTPEKKCQHTNDQRALTGTWFIEEVKKAIEMGYKLEQVHGVYHFEETSTELFDSYIKLFYKLKLISSGIPPSCKTDEDLENYMAQVLEREGIELTKEDFTMNPGMRQLSKLLINSLWGKFGLRRNLPAHDFCKSIEEISALLHDDTSRVSNIIPLHENLALVTSAKISEQYCEVNNHANIYVASTTTAWARLELYKLLEKLGERAIYMDTDSVIFEADENNPENNLQTGSFLGELTNELKIPGDYITDFISGGPKNYGFRTANGEECIKVKGFSLNYTNKQAFTFDNMKNVIVNFLDMDPDAGEKQASRITAFKQRGKKNASNRDAIMQDFHSATPDAPSALATNNAISVFNPHTIKRSNTWKLLKAAEQKLYTVNYDKRIVMADFNTYPFGYRFD